MLSRKFLKYLSSFQARTKTILEMSEVPVKQVASASSSAAACDGVAGGEAPARGGQRAGDRGNGDWGWQRDVTAVESAGGVGMDNSATSQCSPGSPSLSRSERTGRAEGVGLYPWLVHFGACLQALAGF